MEDEGRGDVLAEAATDGAGDTAGEDAAEALALAATAPLDDADADRC